jgi:hypothetical protein
MAMIDGTQRATKMKVEAVASGRRHRRLGSVCVAQ